MSPSYISLTDHMAELTAQQYPGLALVEFLTRSRKERTLEEELAIRERRIEELNRDRPAPVNPSPPDEPVSSTKDEPIIDFRPNARPRHTVRFDGSGQPLDQTVTVIRDFLRTAGPVNVETGGFLWAAETPRGRIMTVTRVSGPAPNSKHEPKSVILGRPGDVQRGALRADLVPVGDWHSHPGSTNGWPSDTDQRSWVSALRASPRSPFYAAVIAYRRTPMDPWGRAQLAAWAVYRESATGRYVCEPARLDRKA